jgi:predicted lipid-binding transport protein (Tim44 family)
MRLIAIFLILFMTLNDVAEARSRFRKSFGRRGSRSLFQKNKRPTTYNTKKFSQKQAAPKTFNRSQPRRSGTFLRSMAGAFAGTMIGGMLFRAFGMNPANGGGGFMLILLILFGFGAYFLFKRRYGLKPLQQTNEEPINFGEIDELEMVNDQGFMTERSRDFFSIQHAWSKKDLSKVEHLMTSEISSEFSSEIEEMKSKGHTSTLENLMVQDIKIVSSWNELEMKCATLKFDVSLIEYETDANGNVISGDKDQYTTMTEYWTFSKSPYDNNWKVCAVENF